MRVRPAGVEGWRGRLRLWSGCVLFTYVTTHLVNHALGLVSLDAMEVGRFWFLALWRHPLGAVALYSAFLIHIAMALWSIYRRRTWRMPAWEATQLSLGLTIPALLARHVVGTRMANLLYGQVDPYARVALSLWHFRPDLGLRQKNFWLVAWTDGCIGIHFWLRLRPWYPRVRPLLFATAVLLPVLALLGFVNAGRTAAALAREPGGAARLLQQTIGPAQAAALAQIERTIPMFLGALGLVLLARAGTPRPRTSPRDDPDQLPGRQGGRRARRVHHPRGQPARPDPPRVGVRRARALLDVPRPRHLRIQGHPRLRAPTSGGCSNGWPRRPASGSPASHARGAMWPSDRWCRPRPRRPRSLVAPRSLAGSEQEVTVLFADLRKFTALAERRLPYDVVFFLNRYFEAWGHAIEEAGGVTNQFTGDGVMALFGVDTDPARGCRQALLGAQAMARSVAALSRSLADDLDEPLRIGIGIHTGPAVVGQMGYGETGSIGRPSATRCTWPAGSRT